MPCSNSVVRSTSPVTSSEPSSRNDGSRRSTTSKPVPSSALRLGAAISTSSRPGSASRRRLHASGGTPTGRLARPSSRASPCMPPTLSKWPWLRITASTSRGESSSRRMFSTSPSGEIPVSNSSRCSRPPRTTLTSAEKPCSARSPSNASPRSSTGAGTRGPEPITGRRAGPSSTSSMSVTLSTRTVTDSASIGSSAMGSGGMCRGESFRPRGCFAAVTAGLSVAPRLLAPMGVSYADLHCHLLPGIDDGAKTMEETLVHAHRLHAEGVRDVACTPHVKRAHFPHVALPELAERRRAAQHEIDRAGLSVRLHPGGELAHEDALELPKRELDLIAQGPPEAPWLLLECPFAGLDDEFEAAAARLADLGYGRLLAHPERAAGGHERLRGVLEAGALLQVNVCSLLGNHGLDAQDLAVDFVRTGRAYCLASDGHPGTREHTLQLGFHLLIRAGASGVQAYRLTQSNPRFLLQSGTPHLAAELAAPAG